MIDCIFCKIIAKDIPSTFIAETDDLIVIKDIAPKATIHYLIIPKKHVADIRVLEKCDQASVGIMIMMAQDLAKALPEPKAFRLVINNGPEAGQCIFHLHMHFLAGKKISAF